MKYDNVLFFATVFEVTAIHKKFCDKPISFEIGCGAKGQDDGDGEANRITEKEPYTHDSCTWYLEIEHEKPCSSVRMTCLDFRRRIYNANMLEKIAIEMVRKWF